jgi:outer membrane protein assembly factor BamB
VSRRTAIVLAVIVLGGIGIAAGGWLWYSSSQPEEQLGSPTVEFDPKQAPPAKPPPKPKPNAQLPWLMYGYDRARTHSTPVHAHRPPFAGRWMVRIGGHLEYPAVVARGRVFIAQGRGRLLAIDGDTGKVAWKKQYANCTASSPLLHRGVVYLTLLPRPCSYGPRDVAGLLVALDPDSGKELWRFTGSGPSESSPLALGSVLYFGSWDHKLYALDLRTRKLRFATELDDEIHTSPAFANGSIYVGTNAGSMYSVDARTGRIQWRGQSHSRFPGGREYFYATPALAYGRVFAPNTDGWVYAFGATTGNLLWAQQAGTYVYTAPAIWRRTVYVGSYDGNVYAFDAATGRLRWRWEAWGSIHGAPTVMNGLVYFSVCGVCGRNGSRYAKSGPPGTFALNARTGKLVWRFYDGRYSPVVADENRVYLTGKGRLWGLDPCPRRATPGRVRPYEGLLRRCGATTARPRR